MPRAVRIALAAAAGAGAFAAPAQAAVTRTTLATGADVASSPVNVPQADGAPDGSAIVTWIQRDGGVDHLFASRIVNGAWTAKVRIDAGLPNAPGSTTVGIGDTGRATIAFTSGPAGAESLYLVTATSNGAAFGAPQQVGAATGWSSLDLDVGSSGDGYLAAHQPTKVQAFRISGGTATKVDGPTAGALNAAPTGDASGAAPKQANVGVNAAGTTAYIAWTEQDGAMADHAFARKITGTAAANVGPAVSAAIPDLNGAPAVTNGNDEFSVAVGQNDSAWIAFRQNFTYGMTNKARSLVRSFDGTTFGAAQVIDGAPLTPAEVTDGAENPLIAVDAAGHGVAVSSGQLDNLTHVARLDGTTWSRGTIVPATGTVPRVAMTAAGTGLQLLTPVSPANTFTARISRGPADGTTETVNDGTQGPLFASTGTAAAGDSAVVLYRQGQAADAKMIVATVPLPTTPAATATPTPTPGAGAPPAYVVPTFKSLRLSKTRILRENLKPLVLTTPSKRSPYLDMTVDRPARIVVFAERVLPGKRSKSGKCVASTAKTKRRKSCTRYVLQKDPPIIVDRPAGRTLIRFTGRLSGKKVLPKGNYRLGITAADQATGALTAIQRLRVTLR
ncbi:MAG: hypothetical protein PGN13_08425 [Patulibacter minatonensis]